MQHDLTRRLEEEELEEGVQDLLDHLIVLLLGSQQILKHLDQVRGSYVLRDFIITADSSYQHHTFEDYIILSIAVHEVVMKELN